MYSSLQPRKRTTGASAPLFVQTKLTVNSPGDKYEQEADRVADKVMQMPISGSIQQQSGISEKKEKKYLQRKSASPSIANISQRQKGGIETDALSTKVNSSNGSGFNLDNTIQSFMSNRFGVDFSNVKIHTDNDAVQMNRELNANAFTMGNDIYFNHGEYQPQSQHGKHLLAHELTHVMQQRNASEAKIQRQVKTPDTLMPALPPFKPLDLRENASPLLASSLGSVEINKFATGKSEIPLSGIEPLIYAADQILYFLDKYPLSEVQVIGHTDRVGKDEKNISLGQERADAVKDFLLKAGVPPSIITTESKGESNPAVATKDQVSEPRNRRVQVLFKVKKSSVSFGVGKSLQPGTSKPPIDVMKGIKDPPRGIPYRDPSEGDLWKRMEANQKRIDEFDRLHPRDKRSIRDRVIDHIIDSVAKPIIKKLPESLQKKAEEIVRDALKSGSEKGCESLINQLPVDEMEKNALKAACKAGMQQELK